LTTRLFADRRGGVDRRAVPRRRTVAPVPVDRRQTVDLRRGVERRSTLDRRGRMGGGRHPAMESPAEHVRNALQLLMHASLAEDLGVEPHADLTAALARLERALRLLERRAP
jgi:hypothetical protein